MAMTGIFCGGCSSPGPDSGKKQGISEAKPAALGQAQPGPYLKNLLASLKAGQAKTGDKDAEARISRTIANLNQIEADMKKTGNWLDQPIACYLVPPMSSVKRLPDIVPLDGSLGREIKIFAAKGEFEPASFVVFSFADMPKVELKASELKNGDSLIPASALDMKVVKCWYQGGTAWHSYFADPTQKTLVPELLLNDENLIMVDHKTRDNYLRVNYPGGTKYVWVSYPESVDPGKFNYGTEPVADSPTLRPVKLNAGEGKQFWLTVKVPDDAAAGTYKGKLCLSAEGKTLGDLEINLHVLPFSLPVPKTYYDINREFYASIYTHSNLFTHMSMNGLDFKQAERKLLAEMKDMRDHNVTRPLTPHWDKRDLYKGQNREIFKRHLELMKESGLATKPVFGALSSCNYAMAVVNPQERDKNAFSDFKKTLSEELEVTDKVFGHRDIYAVGWDEPSMRILIGERECWEYVQSLGAHIMSTSKDKHLLYAGYNEEFSNYPGWPKAESARKWHAIGGRITNYAGPHTGPENPDYIRRTHGMQLYKADYDATCNYQHYEGGSNIWNEFNHGGYRSFCMVYPSKEGVIDTMAWEGVREALDDVRYATKLRELAMEASSSSNMDTRYAGTKALQWLALFDEKKGDLNTMRMEMINHILKISKALKGEAR